MSAYDKTILNISTPTTLPAVPNTEYFVLCDGAPGVAPYDMDAFYNSQTTILHFEGENNAASPITNNWAGGYQPWLSSNGDGGYATGQPGAEVAVISTAQKKFGNSSIYLQGSRTVLCHSAANTFKPAGDLTIDFWFYPTAAGAGGGLFGWGGDNTRLYMQYMTGNVLKFTKENQNPFTITSTNTFTVNAWNHVAVTRRSGTVRVFLNGVLAGSGTDSSTWFCAQYHPVIGGIWEWYGIRTFQTGYYDEFRMNLNFARFPDAGFTPPTAPYANTSASARTSPAVVGSPTLPSTAGNSCIYHIKNICNTSSVNISAAAGQTIENISSSWLLRPFESVSLIASGTDWKIF